MNIKIDLTDVLGTLSTLKVELLLGAAVLALAVAVVVLAWKLKR